jgi:hypothetical protein
MDKRIIQLAGLTETEDSDYDAEAAENKLIRERNAEDKLKAYFSTAQIDVVRVWLDDDTHRFEVTVDAGFEGLGLEQLGAIKVIGSGIKIAPAGDYLMVSFDAGKLLA